MASSSIIKTKPGFKAKATPIGQSANNSEGLISAMVIASHGRHFLAQDDEGNLWQVYGKGKRREVAVGDELSILPSGDKQAWVEHIQTRKNLLYRSDAMRSKLFAANLDQVVLVLAVSPPFSPELLGRTMVACAHADVPLTIVFNKSDLLEGDDELRSTLEAELTEWTQNDIPVHFVSVTEQTQAAEALLRPLLTGKRTLILGQSGMGKSTLINLLIPQALAATNDISMALNAGKHTTTHTQMHFGENQLELIDSPGFQAFGLHHLTENDLLNAFPDVRDEGRRCHFANCQHKREPGCAVKQGLENGVLSAERYALYQLLKSELAENLPRY